jgi:hypothetical protein
MASPLPTLFGRHHTKQLDLDQPDGCDHDQNVYHYRLVDGAMVLRGIALGHGWENRQMDWRGLSCYKRKEDEQMAQITQESGRPEPRADKDEIMAKAKVLIDGGMKVAQAARELGVPGGTLAGWISKERRQAEKARRLLESVDGSKKLQDKVTEVALCADCGREIAGTVFQSGHGARCFRCAVNTVPIDAIVPDFVAEDGVKVIDLDEPIPYIATHNPLDAQIDVMLDALWAEKKAKLKAHLKPLLADVEAWEMVKCIVSRGLA